MLQLSMSYHLKTKCADERNVNAYVRSEIRSKFERGAQRKE